MDIHGAEGAGLRRTLLEVYVPRYGPQWAAFLDSGPVVARSEAARMFTFHMAPEESGPASEGAG